MVQKKILETTKKVSQNIINQDIETAILMLKANSDRYLNAKSQVEMSTENMSMVETRIAAGTINPLEFTVAQGNLQRAISNQIQTKFRWILQKKILSFYQTGEFDFQ